MIEMDRLDYLAGYIQLHRDHIIKDLTSNDSKRNECIQLINEARLVEMDHLLQVIEDINNKTIGTRK